MVREEQKRKKEHQKKVKQQLEEDKMIRKMKPILSKADSLSAAELADHATSIAAFLAENGRYGAHTLSYPKFCLLRFPADAWCLPGASLQ